MIINGHTVEKVKGNKKNTDSAFTLLEITIALAVLATALTILLGLQTSIVDRTVLQREQQEALKIARSILTAIEARETAGVPLKIGAFEGTPDEILEGLFQGSSVANRQESNDSRAILGEKIRASLKIDYWGIPSLDEKAMKRVDLKVYWGYDLTESEKRAELLEYLFFIPFDEDEVTDDSTVN